MKKKFLISFIVSLICFGSIFFIATKIFFIKKDVKQTPTINNIVLENEVTKSEKINNEITFLMMGVDSVGAKSHKNIRTDTLMLFKFNFETGNINLLSLPRDTRVLVKGKLDKINHAHSFGGTDLTMSTVKDFLNIDLDYYLKVDYNLVIDVVNAIGGLKIDVPFLMEYKDPTAKPPLNIHLEKGLQDLNGKEAHDFLRWRKNNSLTVQYVDGDVGRIKTQQYFMTELVKQTLKLKNMFKLQELVETYYNNVETNIPWNIILKSVVAAKNIDTEKMITETIPGESKYIGTTSYYIYDELKTETLVKTMFGSVVKSALN